jgi:signal transduction histidine kinase
VISLNRTLRILCLWLLIQTGAWAQSPTAFSDQQRLALATNPAAALAAANTQLTALSQRSGNRPASYPEVADAIWVRAQAAWRLGDAAAAQADLRRIGALRLTGTAASRMAGNRNFLRGQLARQQGDFPVALNQFQLAQRSYIAARDARGQGLVLSALGALYTDVADNESAFRYLNLAEDVYRGDDLYLLSLNNNFGVALVNADRPADAVSRYSRAALIADRLNLDAYSAIIRANIAIAQLELGRDNAARETLRRLGDPSDITNPTVRNGVLRTHATLALRSGDNALAIARIEQLFDGIDIDDTDSSFRFAHGAAYEIYVAAGQFQDALRHLQSMRRLEEADGRLLASNRAALLAAQFGYDAQEAQIDRLKAEQLARSVSFERQRNSMQRTFTLVVSLASLLLLALLIGLLVTALRSRNRARRDEAQLAITNSQLEHALNAKSEFLASTSHEMRTPLNGIVGMTQILLADPNLPRTVREQIELVSNAGGAMRTLVDDLLDVAKIERGGFSINPQPDRIVPILTDVVAQARANAQLDGLALDLRLAIPDEVVLIDAGRLRQVVVNLVGNALKFTDVGSVMVRAHIIDRDAGPHFRLEVEDTGPGIAAQWHDSIFQLFSQIDGSRTRRYGGTGLGLAICKQITEAMGGSIRVESEPGRGSTFIVEIPYLLSDVQQVMADDGDGIAELIIVASNPLRASLLATMVERSGRTVQNVAAHALPDFLGTLDQSASAHMLIIDAKALEDLTIDPAHPAFGGDLALVIAGDADEAAEHPLRARAQAVPFALNALLPVVGLATAGVDSDLQFAHEKRTVTDRSDPQRSVEERNVGSG